MLHKEDDANIAIEIIVQWITYPILLIGREDRWPPDATNATTNRQRESRGSRMIY